ncbi:MAG: HIT domain-containing protein [Legionellaceae bacterium]|nr:HIT domain-containing protein [Legionellaceae bacterium]
MNFAVDYRIEATCVALGDWPLSRVFLKNNKNYPWLILVPRQDDIQEIEQLSQTLRYQLMDEISQLSTIVRQQFQPDKLNVGTLGNIVSQLHVHVIARYTSDVLWPQGVWQSMQIETPYNENILKELVSNLQAQVQK